jgi:hypothetical protein
MMSRAARHDTPTNPLQCRARAAHIRALALAMCDPASMERLNAMAREFDLKADRMEREAAEALNASNAPPIEAIDR